MSYLSVNDITKRFGGLLAVDRCSFEIQQHRTTCLIGPNGAGKTTMFNAITGFFKLDEGEVTFNGRPISGLRPQAIVKLGLARSFQNLRLLLESTVLDNVLLALADPVDESPWGALATPWVPSLRRARAAARAEALAILDEVGLASRARELTANLSYGEQKLLCIARLLATGADLLLLDEPASGLDAEALDAVIALLGRLRSRGKTLVIIEHNVGLVRRIADEVLFLHQGRLIAQGNPEAIIARADLTDIYFGGGAVLEV